MGESGRLALSGARLDELAAQGYLSVRRHPDAELFVWNYTHRAQHEGYWTDETLACRGLILDGRGNVVARPFQKFFNLGEHQDPYPEGPFHVLEKLDGSLGVMYQTAGGPALATRGSFTSDQAVEGTRMLRERVRALSARFDPDLTYLFEIIYPENRIVVDYRGRREVVLLGAVETRTGRSVLPAELPDLAGWPQARGFGMRAHPREVQAELGAGGGTELEGYVLYWPSTGLRLKAKFDEYVRLHRLLTGVTASTVWDLLRHGHGLDELLANTPEEFTAWIQATVANLTSAYAALEGQALQLYAGRPHTPDRRLFAAYALSTPLADVLFRMLDGKSYNTLIWKRLQPAAERPFKGARDG